MKDVSVNLSARGILKRRFAVVQLSLAVLTAPSFAAPPRVSPRDFPVMAWGSSPSDPAQLQEMRDAGLNVSGFCRVEDLDKVRAAGLACFVTDPRVDGYDFEHMAPDDQVRAKVAHLKRDLGDRPEVLGFFLRDEAPAPLLAGMGRIAAILRESMPDKLPYVNVFPYRVRTRYMGSPDFESYMKTFVAAVDPPFLSYDNYSLVNGEMLDYFYTNLDFMWRWSRQTGKPFWNVILSNAHFAYMEPTDATLRLQVYGTLAYGGRGIQYFTYLTPAGGNYRLAPIDPFGNKTPTWDMLRRINHEIHVLAPVMRPLRSLGVSHYPDVPEQGRPLKESRWVESVEMNQRFDEWAVKETAMPPVPARFLLGEFEDPHGRPYLMVVNKSLQHAFTIAVQLKQAGRKLKRISPYGGGEEDFSGESRWLSPGGGVLLRVD